jgi:hypothetical protein
MAASTICHQFQQERQGIMKWRWKSLIIVVLAVALGWSLHGVVWAVDTVPLIPTDDAFVRIDEPDDNSGDNPELAVQGQIPIIGACQSTAESYLKFDLSSIPDPIEGATLTFLSTFASSGLSLTMGLFGSLDDTWAEDTITWNNKPAISTTQLSQASLTPAGNEFTFPSTPELIAFLESQRLGDGVATLGVIATDCNAFVVTQAMSSKEGTQAPVLELEQPTAVVLASFDATPQDDHILLAWETVAEIDNLGFDLYRSQDAVGPGEQINPERIPSAAPGSSQGFFYEFRDYGVERGRTYYYWLEDVDTAGNRTRHGPVHAALQVPTAVTLATLNAARGENLHVLLALALVGAVVTGLVVRRKRAQ